MTNNRVQKIIQEVYQRVKNMDDKGKPASYIPELAKINPAYFGVYLSTINNYHFGIGDWNKRFSIQSIAKVLSLCMAYRILGKDIWLRVNVEPSGTPFNSLVQLESDKGIPRNPFINSGAIVVCDILLDHLKNPKDDFLAFARDISDNPELNYNSRIAASEKSVGYLNIALCNYIKSLGNIKNSAEEVLDFYFNLCSLEMTCEELSKTFLFLAYGGNKVTDEKEILNHSQCKRINALMQTCGFYDESGEFAFLVGLPGKSGVGGGIIAVHPGKYTIAVWSPGLNTKGNSYRGVQLLEQFTTETQESIF
jgi:glutaminase